MMSSTLWVVTLAMAVGQAPYGGCSTCNGGGGYATGGNVGGGGYAAGGGNYGGSGGAPLNAGPYGGSGSAVISGGPGYQGFYTNSGGTYDQLYPYDYHESWVRGHWQEMPAYGGFHHFRPYNYKHLLSQSQIAAGWGMSATTPYSHEYFRRVHPQASYDQPRLSQYPAPAANHAEVARARPQRELPQTVPTGLRTPSPGELPPGYSELPASSTIDPAVYVRQRNNNGTVNNSASGNNQNSSVQNAEQARLRQKQLELMQGLSPQELQKYAAQYEAAQRQSAGRR